MKVFVNTKNNKTRIIFPSTIMFINGNVYIKNGKKTTLLKDELVEIHSSSTTDEPKE